jgi:hypothetical protein
MKTMSVVAGFALALLFSGGVPVSSTAWAQSVQIGPGGVRVDPDGGRRGRRHERWEGRRERCETVVERRRNRFGEMVTRRTRVCR